MSLSVIGLASLVLTTLALFDAETLPDDDFLPLLGLLVVWFDFTTSATRNLSGDEEENEEKNRGPYMLMKSIDTLPAMMEHESVKWIRFFFRSVGLCSHFYIIHSVCSCTHQSFFTVCDLIRDHPVFQSTGTKPQRPVEIQLATFLRLYGGTRQHHLAGALSCNVGAGTTFLYVDRVVEALGDLSGDFVRWPNELRRAEIRDAFSEMGFPGAIGAVDGSLIQFADKPATDAIYYYCRKKFYGVRSLVWSMDVKLMDWTQIGKHSSYRRS